MVVEIAALVLSVMAVAIAAFSIGALGTWAPPVRMPVSEPSSWEREETVKKANKNYSKLMQEADQHMDNGELDKASRAYIEVASYMERVARDFALGEDKKELKAKSSTAYEKAGDAEMALARQTGNVDDFKAAAGTYSRGSALLSDSGRSLDAPTDAQIVQKRIEAWKTVRGMLEKGHSS